MVFVSLAYLVRDEVVFQEQTAAVTPAATRASGSVKAESGMELGACVEAGKGDGRVAGGDRGGDGSGIADTATEVDAGRYG